MDSRTCDKSNLNHQVIAKGKIILHAMMKLWLDANFSSFGLREVHMSFQDVVACVFNSIQEHFGCIKKIPGAVISYM